MAGVKQGNAAGAGYLQMWMLNSSNIAIGQQTSTPAADTTTHALKVDGFVSAAFDPRQSTVVEFRDSDTFNGKIAFGGRDMQPFDVEIEQVNATAIALWIGANVDETTNSVWDIFGMNPKKITLPNVGLEFSQKFQSRETATAGQNKWLNHFIPIATVDVIPGGLTFQDKNPWRIRVTPSMGTKFPNGVAFSSTQGWTGNTTDYYCISADYPIGITTYVGNASQATFVAGYRPISTTITAGATPNWYAEDGTAEALTSIVIATGVATPDAPPGNNVVAVLMYETEFTAI